MNKPEIIINVACSLDGMIASSEGPLHLSNKKDWLRVYTLRNSVDAILIGISTVIKDNPTLTIKEIEPKIPLPFRIILDTNCRIPLSSNILMQQEQYPTVIFYNHCTDAKLKKLEDRTVKVEFVNIVNGCEHLNLAEILHVLYTKYNVQKLLVEGGSQIITSFITSDLVDKMLIFYSPIFVGTKGGIPLTSFNTVTEIHKGIKFQLINKKQIGEGILLELEKISKNRG